MQDYKPSKIAAGVNMRDIIISFIVNACPQTETDTPRP